jgi:hypothetical protein
MVEITSSLYDRKTKVTVSEDDCIAVTMNCGSRIVGKIYEIIASDGALVLSTDFTYDDLTIDIDEIEKIEKLSTKY